MTGQRRSVAFMAVLASAAVVAGGCGGGGNGKGGSGPTITVKGTLSPGLTLAPRDGGVRRLLRWLGPQRAWAAPAQPVDSIVAVDARGQFYVATPTATGFSLALPAGGVYLIAFLSGTTTVAIYEADPSGDGWSALPVSAASRDVDLGTLTFDASGAATGTTAPGAVRTGLGVDAGVAETLAVWDAAMKRLANVDVDGDGVFDFLQDRAYWFALHYELDPNRTFAQIQGALSDQTATTYLGYGYYFGAAAAGHTWSTATLTAPAAITPHGGTASATTTTCFADSFGGASVSVNFYCGSGSAPGNIATAPVQPPAGDYTVTVDGGTTYRFRNVASQTIDANLYNVYLPSVRLGMSGGKVATLEVQWWKRTPAGWSQPSAAELSAVVASAGFELGQPGWAGTTADRVRGDLPVAPGATVSVPAQAFTPGVLRLTYSDAFGYAYGFEWR